jgi:phosphoribosylanthranilate isomerase
MTRVKICGIRRSEDAELAVELGASALGFNFYPFSKRYITPERARRLIAKLPPFVTPVGIFADETDVSSIRDVALESGVTTLQLHGAQPRIVDDLRSQFRIIRAMQISVRIDHALFRQIEADALLLDAYDPALRGGTGKVFDWSLACAAKKYGPVILAGGLKAENVARAIRAVQPYAVDVASGVEDSPGVKNHTKLRAFFRAVREAERAPDAS